LNNDLVYTPKDLHSILNQEFNFTFDPCPAEPTFNGLEINWGEVNYVNPPFSAIENCILWSHLRN